MGWSTAPTYEEKQQLTDPGWHPTPDRLKLLEFQLDRMIEMYTENPSLSVYDKYEGETELD